MNNITLKNFRCFREEQTVRLAPLTLLVGENSTGKTSFMAMVRSLWDAAYQHTLPDFKEEPYDLGSFDEIAHYRGGRGGRAATFELAFTSTDETLDGRSKKIQRARNRSRSFEVRFEVEFGEKGTAPFLRRQRLSSGDTWIEYATGDDQDYWMRFGTQNGTWGLQTPSGRRSVLGADPDILIPLFLISHRFRSIAAGQEDHSDLTPLNGSEQPSDDDWNLINRLADSDIAAYRTVEARPYASAPVRSKPQRTYDPVRPVQDPEGDYIPTYLANVYFQDQKRWERLKAALENFGHAAGLFDEISIKPLGKKGSEPFQVQIRKFGNVAKGPPRNLIDVGYGVSQVLPVLTELLRPDGPNIFLLQQPEVHLHPSAQAALGSFFCNVANPSQLIVETHSDHLLDRVRMEVRDGTTQLNPDEVSILFFERHDLNVLIHSLRLDEQGNVLNAPPSYRRFFMEETHRDLGL